MPTEVGNSEYVASYGTQSIGNFGLGTSFSNELIDNGLGEDIKTVEEEGRTFRIVALCRRGGEVCRDVNLGLFSSGCLFEDLYQSLALQSPVSLPKHRMMV